MQEQFQIYNDNQMIHVGYNEENIWSALILRCILLLQWKNWKGFMSTVLQKETIMNNITRCCIENGEEGVSLYYF